MIDKNLCFSDLRILRNGFPELVGSKTEGGAPASYSESNRDCRERLAALAAETIDLAKVS